MDPFFVILSGTYVGPELVSEFGRLPPCFLPNGTQRLFEAQIAFARTLSSKVAMSLPADFHLSPFDSEKLEAAGVRVLRTDPDETLAAGLTDVLRALGCKGRVFLLFGDTLVHYSEPGSEPDSFASGSTHHLAMWADYTLVDGRAEFHQRITAGREPREVVAGFFDFAKAELLDELLTEQPDFISVLNGYAAARPFKPVEAVRWLDFGHLHTYHRSRRTELAARAFNQVIGDGLAVRKSGTPSRKIFAEARWYQNLPNRFRPFVPHFIDLHRQPQVAYEIEYLYLPILSELYCFASLPSGMWVDILASCKDFLELCQAVKPEAFETPSDYHQRFFDDMLVSKTYQRLETFARSTGLSLDEPWRFGSRPMKSLSRVAEDLIATIRPTTPGDICMWHGDFHFANIFFDFRSQRVKVVDPRGMLSDGTITMFGDARYDIAKLTHSIIGMYDYLVADRFKLDYAGDYAINIDFGTDPERDGFVRHYSEMSIGPYACGDARMVAMVALLFLSMLPLHDNDKTRQLAMLANGLRLAQLVEQLG